MRHTTEIKLVNRRDAILAEEGIIEDKDVRQMIVKYALVDTGVTRISIPKPLIQHLGLKPVDKTKSRTANGIVERTVYSEVEFTVLGRSGSMQITDLPDDTSVLVGHYVVELLDLVVDPKRGLIYNPDHGDDWIEEQL